MRFCLHELHYIRGKIPRINNIFITFYTFAPPLSIEKTFICLRSRGANDNLKLFCMVLVDIKFVIVRKYILKIQRT